MIQYFRTPPHRRRHARVMWILGAAAILLFLLFFAALCGIRSMHGSISGTDAAERWQAQDSPYSFAQLAVYTDSSAAFDLNTVQLRRMNITKKLEENAFAANTKLQYVDFAKCENEGILTQRDQLGVNEHVLIYAPIQDTYNAYYYDFGAQLG